MLVSLFQNEMRDCYYGYHQFMWPSANGYMIFEVYPRAGQWFWSEFDDAVGAHTGFEYGPFETSQEAYRNAMNFGDEPKSKAEAYAYPRVN